MGIGDAYATAAQYRAAISHLDTSQDSDILTHLTAVSRVIEAHLGRHFTQDATVVARFYEVGKAVRLGESRRELWVPDIATATGFILKRDEDIDGSFADETAWTIDVDFELHDMNAASEPEARPYTKIVIPRHSSKDLFADGQRLQITSKKGWPAVPSAITRADIDLTAILRLESPKATGRIPSTAGEDIEASDECMAIVARLMDTYGRPGQTVFS